MVGGKRRLWRGLVLASLLAPACGGGAQPMQPVDAGLSMDVAPVDGSGTPTDRAPDRDPDSAADRPVEPSPDAGPAPSAVWARTYGIATGALVVSTIQPLGGDEFLVAGSLDVDPSAVENRDGFAMRLRADGSQVWQKVYGGPARDRFEAARATADGGFVFAGATEIAGGEDLWVVAVDASGLVSWQRRYGRGPGEAANDIVQTDDDGDGVADDGFIAVGYHNGPATGAWVLKLDATGAVSWERYYDNTVSEAMAVRQTAGRGYALTGYRMQPGAMPSRSDAFLLRLDSSGNTLWYRTYALPERARASALEVTADGGFIVAGFADLVAGSPIRDQGWLLKLNEAGGIEWQSSYGGGANGSSDSAFHDVRTIDGGYLLAGTTTADGASSNDYWLVEVDAAGAIRSQQRYGGPGGETAVAIAPRPGGGCLLAGASGSFSATRPAAAWLLSLDPDHAITFDSSTNARTAVTAAAAASTAAVENTLTIQVPASVETGGTDTAMASQDVSLTVATQSR